MEPKPEGKSLLWEMEMEVLAEGREWMRRRMEEKLRALEAERGAISPPKRRGPDQHEAKTPGDGHRRRAR